MSVLSNIRKSLARDAELPVATRLAKGARYAVALASAPLWLRACNRVGARARTIGRPHVANQGRIEIGDDVTLNSSFAATELSSGPHGELRIGDRVAINYGTAIVAAGRVRIGNGVSIGPYCVLVDEEVPGRDEAASAIEVGDDVWIAGRVTVQPGSVIGVGSVITAGSVVSGVIPPGVIAGGVPARVIRRVQPGDAPPPPVVADAPAETPVDLRGHLIADFTIDELAGNLQRQPGRPRLAAAVAPFGQVVQSLMQGPHADGADFAVVWTRPQSLEAFSRLLQGEAVGEPELLAEVVAFAEHVKQGARAYRFTFVPTWTLPPFERGLGPLEGRAGGWAHAVTAMNLRLMDALAGSANVFVLNAERWMAGAGRGASSTRGWYLGKMAFHADVFEQAAADVQAALSGFTGGARKLVILDLDDTLWGGVVGDVGWQALRLGGHDGVGEALVDFQRALKRLSKRGVLLGVVSKNEESVALEAIRSHPEMVLREKDFVGWRINWNDKAQNIADLASELNLGLQSVVFIDDNPVERARVREALPEVLVPEWPEDKLLYPSAFAALRCFDTGAISREDAERTDLYASERQRDAAKKTVGNLDEWLATLETQVRAEPLGPANLARTTQLLNKTNQLNLTTRRCSEAELSAWVKVPGHRLLAVTVSDRFGDAGLTGIVSVDVRDGVAHLVDFVLSCRVMGRRVEETMVHLAVELARDAGAGRVEAKHLPTAKNKPCLEFWKRSGFEALPEDVFRWDASKPYALPKSVTLEWAR